MSYSTYAVIMLGARLGIPLMAALNAALGKIIGNPAGAVVILLLVAMIAAAAICSLTGGISLITLITAPKHLFSLGCSPHFTCFPLRLFRHILALVMRYFSFC